MVSPLFQLTGQEAKGLLFGLLEVDKFQLAQHPEWPSIREAVRAGKVRYREYDPREHWQSYREIVEQLQANGEAFGDCEDLATAVAAEDQVRYGVDSLPYAYSPKEGLFHVVTAVPRTASGRFGGNQVWPKALGASEVVGFDLHDISAAAGMGVNPSSGVRGRPGLTADLGFGTLRSVDPDKAPPQAAAILAFARDQGYAVDGLRVGKRGAIQVTLSPLQSQPAKATPAALAELSRATRCAVVYDALAAPFPLDYFLSVWLYPGASSPSVEPGPSGIGLSPHELTHFTPLSTVAVAPATSSRREGYGSDGGSMPLSPYLGPLDSTVASSVSDGRKVGGIFRSFLEGAGIMDEGGASFNLEGTARKAGEAARKAVGSDALSMFLPGLNLGGPPAAEGARAAVEGAKDAFGYAVPVWAFDEDYAARGLVDAVHAWGRAHRVKVEVQSAEDDDVQVLVRFPAAAPKSARKSLSEVVDRIAGKEDFAFSTVEWSPAEPRVVKVRAAMNLPVGASFDPNLRGVGGASGVQLASRYGGRAVHLAPTPLKLVPSLQRVESAISSWAREHDFNVLTSIFSPLKFSVVLSDVGAVDSAWSDLSRLVDRLQESFAVDVDVVPSDEAVTLHVRTSAPVFGSLPGSAAQATLIELGADPSTLLYTSTGMDLDLASTVARSMFRR